MFNILQANIQSLKTNKNELTHEIFSGKYDVALLSEIWVKPDQMLTERWNIQGYHRVLAPRSDGFGGVGIYLRSDLSFRKITLNSTMNFETLGIKIHPIDLVLVTIYINPRITIQELETCIPILLNEISNHPKVLIGGDFNSHNELWGSLETNNKGNLVYDLITHSNLLIMNTGELTYTPSNVNQRPSAIDLSMCTSNLFDNAKWEVLGKSFGGSGHLMLKIQLQLSYKPKKKFYFDRIKIAEEISQIKHWEIEEFQDFVKISNGFREKHRKLSIGEMRALRAPEA